MRRLYPAIALLMIYLLTPGAGEITADVVHFIREGQTTHDASDVHHQEEAPEHGCSGPYHLCPCHTPSNFLLGAVSAEIIAPRSSSQTPPPLSGQPTPSGVSSPIYRPPIA